MRNEEPSGLHNPVLHELNLAGWLVSMCLQHEEYWSSPVVRGQILECCGETVKGVGELADRLTGHDPEVAVAVRRLADLLADRGQGLERTGD